jgi:hypothetical protein
MNAVSPISVAEQSPMPDRGGGGHGHVFRSRLIDKLAEVETWAVARLRAAQDGKKLPSTLGLRLEAVRKLTDTHPKLFKKPSAVVQLLDTLKPFSDLRSSLAHSKLTEVHEDDGTIVWVFERADSDPTMPWRGRHAIRTSEFGQIIGQVSDLANQIRQQAASS